MEGRKEGNVLFNDALNTFYLVIWCQTYVKDHSDSEKGNPLPSHRLHFLINSKVSFICTIPLFYLMTHSTHFCKYSYMASDIWLRTILIVRGNPLPPQQQGFFYMHHPTDRIVHTTAFVTPVVEHWLEREIAQWVHLEGSIR